MDNEDDKKENTPLGFLQDPNGDNSSGRLIKVVSVIMCIILSVADIVLLSFKTIDMETGRMIATNLILPFIGIAGGSELVQKLTGK